MKLKFLIVTFATLILSTSIYIGANSNLAASLFSNKSDALQSSTKAQAPRLESASEKKASSESLNSRPVLNDSNTIVDTSITDKLRDEIDIDLKQIKHRRYVETLNDPRANAAEKDEALKFMGAYLEKLTRYMKMRNQQIQAMMTEQNNG